MIDADKNSFGDISDLARKFGTPFVVYSEALLHHAEANLRRALPSSAELAYSIKANPNPALIRHLVHRGLMAEAASAGELRAGLSAGAPASRILLGGPTKSEEGVAQAISHGVFAILVESQSDLSVVRTVAEKLASQVSIVLRVNPSSLASNASLKMGGIPSPFGLDEELLPELINACTTPFTQYSGLFLYAGSQIISATEIVDNTRYLCRLALRLRDAGLPAATLLDFGGGFGVPEAASQPELDLDQLHDGLSDVYDSEIVELSQSGLRTTIFESGRYLVSRAACYVARVLDIRESQGKRFAVLDGGINHIGIRQLKYRTHEPIISIYGRTDRPLSEPTVLVGPTCTPIDIVHSGCNLPRLNRGDLVVQSDFGAYTVSFSPIHFCGHPWPAEVMVTTNGEYKLIRRRGKLEEAMGFGYLRGDT